MVSLVQQNIIAEDVSMRTTWQNTPPSSASGLMGGLSNSHLFQYSMAPQSVLLQLG